MNCELVRVQIKKRSLPQWLSLGVFAFPFLLTFFMDFLKLPSVIKYTIDLMWLVLLFTLFIGRQIKIKKNITPIVIIVSIWLLYVVLVYVFNYQSIFYFLWGIRNNFRFYVAFIAFATFFNKDDVEFSFKFIDCLFWVNVIVTLYQFFALDCQQDYLGGIFGVERGCNAYTSILFAVVVLKSLLNYFEGKESTKVCLLKCSKKDLF